MYKTKPSTSVDLLYSVISYVSQNALGQKVPASVNGCFQQRNEKSAGLHTSSGPGVLLQSAGVKEGEKGEKGIENINKLGQRNGNRSNFW